MLSLSICIGIIPKSSPLLQLKTQHVWPYVLEQRQKFPHEKISTSLIFFGHPNGMKCLKYLLKLYIINYYNKTLLSFTGKQSSKINIWGKKFEQKKNPIAIK